jgi:hypothetical protein
VGELCRGVQNITARIVYHIISNTIKKTRIKSKNTPTIIMKKISLKQKMIIGNNNNRDKTNKNTNKI